MAFSIARLSQHVEQALAQASPGEVLAYAWRDGWQQDENLAIKGREIRVRHCESSLQAREALTEAPETPQVLLISCDETSLGQDVLARLFRNRLLHIDRWQMVAEAYGAVQIDPRLYDISWMADALLDAAPHQPPASHTVLTQDQAMRACLSRVLGLEGTELDLATLLVQMEMASAAWIALPKDRKEVFQEYLTSQFGGLAEAILGAATAGNGHAVLAIGLVCEILFNSGKPAPEPLRDARVRLEPRLGGVRLEHTDACNWARMAKQALASRDDSQKRAVFQKALDLLKDLRAEEFIIESSILPEALEQRLGALAKAVEGFLRNPDALNKVEQAADSVLNHEGTPRNDPAKETSRMVLRLCHREARIAEGATRITGISDYLQHGAWEDWARRSLRVVRPDALARATGKLLERVSKRRSDSDHRFATELADHVAQGSQMKGLLPVEDALGSLAARVAAERPLLILVLDGMSWDVYLEIALQLEANGWTPWKHQDGPLSLLATVPSVTECSRASLLAGQLTRGNSSQEKRAFARIEGLKRHSRSSKPPVLLHKADLEENHQLSKNASDLLADSDQAVIGVVINAIDDALSKSEQVRIEWSMDTLPLLGAVLAQARQANRAVLLTSDHGHVIERGAEYRRLSETERWRPANDKPSNEEVLMDGPRVSALMDGPIIVPWSESLRYTGKKNGYHGGATQQEMLVPMGIWTSDSERLECCEPAFIETPEWWIVEEKRRTPKSPARLQKAKSADDKRRKAGEIDDLFARRAPERPGWIESLLTSNALKHQRERVGRLALEDERLEKLLRCLQDNGDRASITQLASAIGQPQMRMRGVLSILQRMLNLDGYPALTIESATQTVMLDVRILRTQFEL